MKMINHVKITFKSIPENVAFARSTAGAFAAQLDCSLEEIEELKLAVSEAVSNCIIHAYQNEPDQVVDVYIVLYDNRSMEIQIQDYGRGIADVGRAMEPSFSSEPGRMGLGFSFMQSFMDEVLVESQVNQGTLVRLIRHFAPLDHVALS